MNVADVRHYLRGPMVPVLTNLKPDLSIDHAAIRENVEYVVQRGITTGSGVLLAAGAGGDFPLLSLEERKAVAETIVQAAAGRAPVVVGAQDTNVNHMIEMARWAERIGAYGIQMSSGFYYPTNDDTCLSLFRAVHDATRDVIVMVYNTPWEGFDMSLDLVEQIAKLPRCAALKWSTNAGVLAYQRGVARFAGRMAVVDNQGLHIVNHLLGGAGYVTHLATVWPEVELSVWRHLEANDYRGAQQRIMETVWPWIEVHGQLWKVTGAESPTVKAALDLCGRPGGPSRLTSRAANDDERALLRDVLRRIGVPSLLQDMGTR